MTSGTDVVARAVTGKPCLGSFLQHRYVKCRHGPPCVERAAHPPAPGTRRTRCRPRPIDPSSPRPSELLRAFFAAGLLAIAAAAIAGVTFTATERGWLHWLALHLLFLGGVSQLVLGAGQFFTCAFLATDPPPRTLVAAQLAVWNAGTILVAVGVPTGSVALIEAGAALIGAGLILFAWGLAWMKRRSLQRAPWALRW